MAFGTILLTLLVTWFFALILGRLVGATVHWYRVTHGPRKDETSEDKEVWDDVSYDVATWTTYILWFMMVVNMISSFKREKRERRQVLSDMYSYSSSGSSGSSGYGSSGYGSGSGYESIYGSQADSYYGSPLVQEFGYTTMDSAASAATAGPTVVCSSASRGGPVGLTRGDLLSILNDKRRAQIFFSDVSGCVPI